MSLRKKTLLILGITTVVMIVILFAASHLVLKFRHGVNLAEDTEIRIGVEKAAELLEQETARIDEGACGVAFDQATSDFMRNTSTAEIEEILVGQVMPEFRLDYVLFIDDRGQLVYSIGLDRSTSEVIPVPSELNGHAREIYRLFDLESDITSGIGGLLNLSTYPVMLAARPIRASEYIDHAEGIAVMARRLDADELARESGILELPIRMERIGDEDAPREFQTALEAWRAGAGVVVQRLDDSKIAGYKVLDDIIQGPSVMLRLEMPRRAYIYAKQSTARLTLLVLIVGFVLGTVTLIFLEKIVLSPISHLSHLVSDIGESGDLSARVRQYGKDELSTLGMEINRMLESLEKSKAEILKKSDQLSMLIENQGEGVAIIDRLERFTFANAAAGEIFGMDVEELQKKKFSDFVDQEALAGIRAQRNTCRRSGRCTFEFDVKLPSGETKTILATATPRRDEKDGVIGTFEVFRDITDRKRTEILKARLEAKSEFLTMISHELRTPLVPIIGYAELLLSETFGELPDECREPLETIYSRAEALKGLIDDILQINRMERGILDVKLQTVDIRAMLEETLKPYTEISQSKPVDIQVSCDEFNILADPDRIRQVIQNLVGNSIKYSGDSVKITISGQVKDGKGCISVEDNGMGMRTEELPYIFERFYQIEDIHNRTHDGAGLGLAIARELTEKMGGTISVESKQGKGSIFTISMELADDEVPDAKLDDVIVMPSEARTEEEETAIEKRDRILVIDDDEFNIRLLEKILEENYEVVSAMTGSEGLDIIRSGRGFELVLLDWMMPGMDGLSLLVAIKADQSIKDTPVIFVSGKTEPEIIEEGIEAGASGFITKPYNRDEILESIRSAIEESRTASASDS